MKKFPEGCGDEESGGSNYKGIDKYSNPYFTAFVTDLCTGYSDRGLESCRFIRLGTSLRHSSHSCMYQLYYFFRVNILKYKLIWWLANLVPGFIFLSVSRVTYDASKAEEDFLGLFGYDFQLIALLPFIYFVLQLFLLYVWKVERRNDQDKY